MKRLAQTTGSIIHMDGGSSLDNESLVVRKAILVHAGPEGEPIEFQSGDGPIKFDTKRIQTIVDVHQNHLDKLSKEYGGSDKIPMGAFEPILDSHADDSNDRIIGRLTGALKFEIRDVPKVGKNVPCVVAEGITFLGKDTVDRVKDGRIYHLSIGINENDNSLGETSTVVQPAAPGAMLLKHGAKKPVIGGLNMSDQLKRMQAHATRLATLSEVKKTLTSMTQKTEEAQKLMKLNSRKGEINSRLSALCKSAKLTPTEYKLLVDGDKLTRMASMDSEALELSLSIFEARQAPVIHVGQVGSTAAGDAMEFGKDLIRQKDQIEVKRLNAETKKDMVKMSGKKNLFKGLEEGSDEEGSKDMSGPKESAVSPEKDEVPSKEGSKDMSHHLSEMGKHLASGDVEKAKECHAKMAALSKPDDAKEMAEYSEEIKPEDSKSQSGELQSQMDEMKTNLARVAGMVQAMMGAEEEESKHFGEVDKEQEELGK